MRNKKDMHFNMILEACDLHGITNLLQFRHNWNHEVIAEFYSTLFFDKKERIFMWMTSGKRFIVKLTKFIQILGLSSQLDISKKLHSRRVMTSREMTFLGFRCGWAASSLFNSSQDDEEDLSAEDWLFSGYSGL
jgi:hypothetical protein